MERFFYFKRRYRRCAKCRRRFLRNTLCGKCRCCSSCCSCKKKCRD